MTVSSTLGPMVEMDHIEIPVWMMVALITLLAVLATVALGRAVYLRALRWWRHRRAVAGERRAERLLRKGGYRILDRQVEHHWTVDVDGTATPIPLRADLLVSREGKRFIAEVKTGRRGTDIRSAATRRQLLEYRMAYDVGGVLLVDMEHRKIVEVTFPGTDAKTSAG
ncbi:MAG: hypothetical protein KC416_03590 [Myxococcales bacterium]|nr:hypothetical protein [Myxococcales bacterium]